jgi:superfamily II DNA or RNA helicase
MTITLRPYQTEALDEIWQSLQTKTNVLVQASCSAGKTILFAKIVQRLLRENPDYRVIIMADRVIQVVS